MPWRQACILGHAEPTGFQLTLRAEGTVAHELLVWTVGQELMTAPESAVWLWPIEVDETPQSTGPPCVSAFRVASPDGRRSCRSGSHRLGLRQDIGHVRFDSPRFSQCDQRRCARKAVLTRDDRLIKLPVHAAA